ncbi:MAG: PAS domain S-box protein, partial [Sulfurimonadaceae bacterium]|nr:PAS domain S-box protein [Sulfurimonadaceae bacterium]
MFKDDNYQFTYLNHGAIANIGYTIDEMGKMTPLDIKPEYTFESFEELVRPLRDKSQEKVIFETMHKRKNGSLYPVEVHLQLIEYEQKWQFVALILDITQRREAEEELDRYREHLEELVENRTRELTEANEKLQELDLMKTMFIASMSHELRT